MAGRPDPQHRAHGHEGLGLVPVETYRRRILSGIEPLAPLDTPLEEAGGCVLADALAAPFDLPPFASSAMDGFAVRSEDVADARQDPPAALEILGEAQMGRAPEAGVAPGGAVRIATGAPLPPGADCVVPVEDCVVEDRRVLVLAASGPGWYVRPAGEDARAGDVLLPAGRLLTPPDLGVAAAAGRASLMVHPRPRVAILSTGDELVEPGRPAGPGQIYDANAFTLVGAVSEAGAVPHLAGIVPDHPSRVRRALDRVLADADAVVTSAGISMGERDPVKLAFQGRGEVEFLRVAMQPGMPQAFGALDGRPFFGLPGNPVSVFVSFELFVRPALLRLMGRRHVDRPEVEATLGADVERLPAKTRYARVRVRGKGDRWIVAPTGSHQSNLLAGISRADGLAIILPGSGVARAGEECRVILFREPEA